MANFLFLNKRGQRADFSWLGSLEKIINKRFGYLKNVSIALLSDKEMKELNRVYRGKDKATDVLSFSLAASDELGEVLISVNQARQAAKEKKQSLKSQLQLLTVHGILHLLGYDHERSAQEAKQQTKLEEEILGDLAK
ncbi:MAG: rRNA maturation RNase YbeY [Patescibacteria group bacterium]|nr:rRNA maturation RNase YbeY [Patescibacteria group bacterium]